MHVKEFSWKVVFEVVMCETCGVFNSFKLILSRNFRTDATKNTLFRNDKVKRYDN